MFSRVASASRAFRGARVVRQAGTGQRRQMGGGGGFMETNSFGEQVGEVFGTVAWLWVFHRFSQDGAVLLGLRHPWDHGDHGDDHGSGHAKESLTADEVKARWESFSEKAVIPGEDDDDEEDEDEEEEEDDDDDEE